MNIIPRRRGEVQTNASRPTLPFTGLLPFQMDRLFDAFEEGWPSTRTSPMDVTVHVDVEDGDDALTVRAEVAGIDADDLNIELNGDVLTISGEKREEEKTESDKTIYSERRYGSFSRSLTLPVSIDEERVTANHENGVLKITLPKAQVERPRQISIQRG